MDNCTHQWEIKEVNRWYDEFERKWQCKGNLICRKCHKENDDPNIANEWTKMGLEFSKRMREKMTDKELEEMGFDDAGSCIQPPMRGMAFYVDKPRLKAGVEGAKKIIGMQWILDLGPGLAPDMQETINQFKIFLGVK